MTAYRTAEKPATIPIAPLPWWGRNSWIVVRIVWAIVILQGPIVAGVMHDVCTAAHYGLCFAVGSVALGVTVTAITMAIAAASSQ